MSARKPATVTAAAKSDGAGTTPLAPTPPPPPLTLPGDAVGGSKLEASGNETADAAVPSEIELSTEVLELARAETPGPEEQRSRGTSLADDRASPARTSAENTPKSVRITRHSSPLQLGSPTTPSARRADLVDGHSDSEEPSCSSHRKSLSDRPAAAAAGTSASSTTAIRGRKSIKDLKEAKEAAKLEDIAIMDESSDATELEAALAATVTTAATAPATTMTAPSLDEKDPKDTKDNVKAADKEQPLATAATAAMTTMYNRVTRKAHAQELANNTRVTRNRRQSSTVASEPPPPARGRRKKPAPPEPAVKRKRSEDDHELALKYAKIEVKPPSLGEDEAKDAAEEVESVASTDEVVKSALHIKQELHDSDETTGIGTGTGTSEPAVTPSQSGCRRGRGRPQGKTQLATPATRATRNSKAASPAPLSAEPAAPKRRRVGSANRSLLPTKTVSTSSLATSAHAAGDEDSKDSMASSMDDLLLAAAEIKQEKLLPEFDDSLLNELQPLNAAMAKAPDEAQTASTSTSKTAANGHQCSEPLTVDTAPRRSSSLSPKPEEQPPKADAHDANEEAKLPRDTVTPSVNSDMDKAPSLSPDLVSEGVSAISVKQFYKKPEFLANNLGIEKDPELGEIVQIVSGASDGDGDETADGADPSEATASAETADDGSEQEAEGELVLKLEDSFSSSSIKTGDLRIDESCDEEDAAQLDSVVLNGVDAVEAAESEAHDKEKQGEQCQQDDYDAFESEIMQELAKEGVVDASGNALSRRAVEDDEQEVPEAHSLAAAETELETDVELEAVACDSAKETPAASVDELQPLPQPQSAEPEPEPEAEGEPEQHVDKEQEQGSVAVHMDVDVDAEQSCDELSATKADVVVAGIDVELLKQPATAQELLLKHMKAESDCPEENKENVVAAAATEDAIQSNEPKLEADDAKPVVAEQLADEKKPTADACTEDDEGDGDGDVDGEQQRREKERHLQNLGLLTHHAAEQLRQEYIQEASTRAAQQQHSGKRQGGKAGGGSGGGGSSATHVESSGTLKTVIKLNRSSNGGASGSGGVPTGTVIHGAASNASAASFSTRKGGSAAAAHGVRRQSLKMTFQKGRARGHGNADRAADQHGAHGEDSYYTIQNENEDSSHSEGHGQGEHSFYQMVSSSAAPSSKKDEKEKILIPEKASSFKFHPGRLCEDQCYYCSGKFGLYDTPCHVGQIKSTERQQKILANEEKLTVDNCLCDACFRHVDRRANAPSYKKRLSAPGHLETGNMDKHYPSGAVSAAAPDADGESAAAVSQRQCAVKECVECAGHSLRRKCIRKSVKKFLLNFEIPAGTSSVWLCETHYNTVIQSSGCVLCKRRLGKNHMYHITSDTDRLEKALSEMGIPVQLGIGTAVCKLCRYFANLLMKPPDSTKSQKADFVKNYRKRLLKFHNIQDGSNEASECDEEDASTTPASAAAVAPTATAASGCDDAEMVVDYDAPTDSNSSSSSITPLGGGGGGSSSSSSNMTKQMSKLQAILQQNIGAAAAGGAADTNSNSSKSKSNADISNVLRGNPNISMRELFHGEEELGVQFKVPFGSSSSQRTPEGWTRVQTFLQYDEPTRRLWEELQKPYGNQSSFLRHLILLEKYYRNGDLVLAPHASSNATVYTETVRQRLNSFDHGHCGVATVAAASTPPAPGAAAASASVLANALTTAHNSNSAAAAAAETQGQTEGCIPLVELNDDDDAVGGGQQSENLPLERLTNASVDKLTKQLSSNAVTIIARPKETNSSSSKLASSCLSEESPSPQKGAQLKDGQLVPAVAPSPPAPAASSANSRSILKTNLLSMNKAVEIVPLSNSQQLHGGPGSKAMPSEKHQKILDVANKLLGNQSEAMHGKQPKPAATVAPISQQQPQSQPHSHPPNKPPSAAQLLTSPPELISLPRRRTSGPGAGSSLLGSSASKRLQLPRGGGGSANAGARANAPTPNVIILPDTLTHQERHESKSWKPTLIPLEEQNKVPNKPHALYQTADGRRLPALVQVQSGGKPYLISIFDYNRMCILRREKLMRDQMLKASAKPKQQAPSQSAAAHSSAAAVLSNLNKFTQQAARQQLQQLPQPKQQQQLQLPPLQAGGSAGSSGMRLARLAPKQMPALSSPQTAANSTQSSGYPPLLANALTGPAALESNISWLWKNFPDTNQYLLNGNGGVSKLPPHLTGKPATATTTTSSTSSGGGINALKTNATLSLKHQQQLQQQKLIDNAIMSKIPKSLTVIPQHTMGVAADGASGSAVGGGVGGMSKE